MKYPQSEKSELLKISEHFIYSKGYGSMAQTILSMPIPLGSLLSAVFPPRGICLQSCTQGWEFVIYEFILFFNFYLKNPRHLKNA